MEAEIRQATLRPAQAADLPAVRGLLLAAQLPADGLEDQFGEGYVVAEADGKIVGAAGLEVHGLSGLLRSAVVAESLRGTGLGTRLTADRVAWARDRNLDDVWLLTTTAADFFARRGFQPAARESAPATILASREFSAICPSSAVCMRLSL